MRICGSQPAFPSTSENAQPLATRNEREHQWTASTVLPERNDLSAHSPRTYSQLLLTRSIHGPARPLDGELPPKLWTSACRPVKLNVLRRPIELAQYACGDYRKLLRLHGIKAP